MRLLLIALVLALVAAAPATAKTRNVKIGDNYFVRPANNATVSISKGSTLKFVWTGSAPHNVVKKKGPGPAFHSPVKQSGSYSHKFTRGGTYRIVCTIHSNMKLTVKVR